MSESICFDCKIKLNIKCKKGFIYRCDSCRKKHADKLLIQLNKIIEEACKNCLKSFFCYEQNLDGTLIENYNRCSKKTFKQKMELIGDRFYYNKELNPKGYKIEMLKL